MTASRSASAVGWERADLPCVGAGTIGEGAGSARDGTAQQLFHGTTRDPNSPTSAGSTGTSRPASIAAAAAAPTAGASRDFSTGAGLGSVLHSAAMSPTSGEAAGVRSSSSSETAVERNGSASRPSALQSIFTYSRLISPSVDAACERYVEPTSRESCRPSVSVPSDCRARPKSASDSHV